MRYTVFLLLCAVLAACQPVPQQRSALLKVPESFSIQQSATTVLPTERWWQDFNDPTLNQLQQRLFTGNLSLRQAFHRLDQLEAQQRIAGADLLPALRLDGDLQRERTVSSLRNTRTTSGRLVASATYEIDLWWRLRNRATAADLQLLAGEDDVRALMLSLSARMAELYFIGVEQKAQIDLLRRRLQHHQDLVRIIAERYRTGLSEATEFYQAQQNLAQMEAQIPLFETTLIQSENALALLLGQAPGSVRIERLELPELFDIIDIGLPANLISRRPDVSAALLELEAADYELAAALADRLPRLDLTANIGRSVTLLSSGDVTGSLWSLALGLTQPLFDGGRLKAVSDRQQALREERLVAGRLILLTAIEEVESALQSELYSARRARLLERQQVINQSNLQLRRENYLLGLSDSLELLRSEMDQLEIRSSQLSNHRQWISYRISLVMALGGHWMDEELERQRHNLAHRSADKNAEAAVAVDHAGSVP